MLGYVNTSMSSKLSRLLLPSGERHVEYCVHWLGFPASTSIGRKWRKSSTGLSAQSGWKRWAYLVCWGEDPQWATWRSYRAWSKSHLSNAEWYNKEKWPQSADQEIKMELNEADAALVQAAHWRLWHLHPWWLSGLDS